jgi:hypothetical protein
MGSSHLVARGVSWRGKDITKQLGHQGAMSRDAHLRLLAERYGVLLTTLQEAAHELAQGADTDP